MLASARLQSQESTSELGVERQRSATSSCCHLSRQSLRLKHFWSRPNDRQPLHHIENSGCHPKNRLGQISSKHPKTLLLVFLNESHHHLSDPCPGRKSCYQTSGFLTDQAQQPSYHCNRSQLQLAFRLKRRGCCIISCSFSSHR